MKDAIKQMATKIETVDDKMKQVTADIDRVRGKKQDPAAVIMAEGDVEDNENYGSDSGEALDEKSD